MTCTIYILAPYILYFNSRPHEEVDANFSEMSYFFILFQLTTSRRGRRDIQDSILRNPVHFNSRPHEEVDAAGVAGKPGSGISTHDLTKRSTAQYTVYLSTVTAFQLTTSRRGRHCRRRYSKRFFHISTHDPTKRSTFNVSYFRWVIDISTHDLTKRSTVYWRSENHSSGISTHDLTKRSTVLSQPCLYLNVFQLTTSRRGRHFSCDIIQPSISISTHDLTRRSTELA